MTFRYGLATVTLLTMLGGVVMVDLAAAEWGRSSGTHWGPSQVGDEAYTSIATVTAGPGDVVRVPVPSSLPEPFNGLRISVYPGGTGMQPGEEIDRIDGLRAVSGAAWYVRVPDGSQGLDIMRVFSFEPGTVPEGEYFEDWVRAAAGQVPQTADVTSAGAVRMHQAVVGAIWLLIAGSIACGFLWARQTRVTATVDGLDIVELGFRALGFVRATLLWVAIPLAIVAWGMLTFFWNATSTIPGAGPDWTAPLRWAAGFLIATAVAAWAMIGVRLQRVARRWRQQQARSPLA